MIEPLNHYLFIDIETASCVAEHGKLSGGMQREWEKKAVAKWKCTEHEAADLFLEKAAILAEFGKVVCISMGCLVESTKGTKLMIRSIAGDDERTLLKQFCTSVTKFYQRHKNTAIVGHNIAEFDLPYISRRMIIHGDTIPGCINFQGLKPWDLKEKIRDTMQLWAFGDYKAHTSLSLLAEVLNIPTPKDDISGKDVTGVYWTERDLPRIVTYCQKDVETTARIFLKLTGRYDVDFTTEIVAEMAVTTS